MTDKNNDIRILFMGTPDFALFSLRALVGNGEKVIGVVTQPDKPQGRSYKLTPPPVKVYALSENIPVYQPATLKNEAFARLLSEISPDMIIVAAYGKILPSTVIDYPEYGCINVHGSYLPKYRGAAPMQRAIIDGEKQTGVTIMYMDAGIDTGAMLARKRIKIDENDDFETVHDKIGNAGASLLIKTIGEIRNGNIKKTKQYGAYSTYAAKITKEDCRPDFSQSVKKVHDLIRGLSPVPLAVTKTPDGKLLKLTKTRVTDIPSDRVPAGTVVSEDGEGFCVACGDYCLKVLGVLPEGRSRMSASEFVHGRGISVGDILLWR